MGRVFLSMIHVLNAKRRVCLKKVQKALDPKGEIEEIASRAKGKAVSLSQERCLGLMKTKRDWEEIETKLKKEVDGSEGMRQIASPR